MDFICLYHFDWNFLLLLLLLLSLYTSVIYIYTVRFSLGNSDREVAESPVERNGAELHMQVEEMTGRLENRISVLVIVEGESLVKLDKLAGAGNRSAYIRYLINTVDGTEAKKYIELEAQVRVLQKLPKIQGKRISDLELKVDQLRSVNKQLVSGVSPDLGDIPGVLESVVGYKSWLNNLLQRQDIRITHTMQLDRVRINAKDLGVKPQDLLDYIQTALNIKGLDLSKLEEV